MKTAIWWIRRDFRVSDNEALWAAINDSDQLIPLFVLDPTLIKSRFSSEKRLAFMYDGLHKIDMELRQRGSRLVVRSGSPTEVLAHLISETEAGTIYAESDHSPYSRQRDALVQRELPLKLVGGPSVLLPGSVLKADGQPYTVFTPFSRAWKILLDGALGAILPAPEKINSPTEIFSEAIPNPPNLSWDISFIPGEVEAQRRLSVFFSGGSEAPVFSYNEGRNKLDADGSSKLSPYLRFGMLSARQAVYWALQGIASAPDQEARKSAESWLNELIWREFYIHILYHFPYVRERNFRMGEIRWQNDAQEFSAWKEGRTGYPVVDAAMRQLYQTGWMHNRARMIVASFLTKDLLIDWRWGEEWFMQNLIDGDLASNNGGWQWVAGTGTDAAPYFRIFNPVSQGIKFDPQGRFIRQWIPELNSVPDEYIHEPWKMPSAVQASAGCRIGIDYPHPMIDHNWARQRVLNVFKHAK